MQDYDGSFYGTTYGGGTNHVQYGGDGTVFRMATNGTVITLASFDGTNGANPRAGLGRGKDGNFYGTTYSGGIGYNGYASSGGGVVFMITTNGVLASLAFFAGTNGLRPWGGLIQASDGSFYGTTYDGGTFSGGTVFRVSIDPPPATVLQIGSGAGKTIILRWNAGLGKTYQVQFKSNLAQVNWSNCGSTITATSSSLSFSDASASLTTQRFYRVLVLP